MWKPPPGERVKHPLPTERAPTADEAARSMLYSPLTLKSGLKLTARSWVPAMVPWRASEDGAVTDDVVDWYGRFADGAPAVIVVEATGVRDVPSGPLLRAGHDRYIEGLGRIAEVVHRRSGGATRVLVQLIDFLRIRRRPPRDRFLREHLALTPRHHAATGEDDTAKVREALVAMDDLTLQSTLTPREWEALTMGARERVTDVNVDAIRDLPATLPHHFAEAARRVKLAGFDGVELHYAHAYTMSSFLSALNTRDDGYGATREGRVRLPLEVYRAVRDTVGGDFTVGCRMLCDDVVAGGSTVDDAALFAVALARAGMDFLSLSTGGRFEDAAQPHVGEAAYPYTGRSGYECMPTVLSDARGPFGRNLGKQACVRRAVRDAGLVTPIVVAGGIATFAQAEALLQRDEADLIGAARQTLADPDWWRKLREGKGDDVRRCLFTNYCEALDQRHKAVTCQQWDRLSLDAPEVTLSLDRRRRLIAP